MIRLLDRHNATAGWQIFSSDEQTETYDTAGKLLTIQDRSGKVQTLAYDAQSNLLSVTDGFGRQLQFAYDTQNRINAMTQPDGKQVLFAYDAANNLSSITYPDGKVRTYAYEDTRFPNHLTGITDENGVRYATWSYDTQGRGISSQHANGADLTTLSYSTNSTAVTDALGTVRTTSLTSVLGVVKNAGNSQPGGSGCGASASAVTYDANGNVATSKDFNGVQTNYTYDLSRNLETRRVEASGKTESRTISTQWHSYWRQPVKIAEPGKITTWVYNGDGGKYCAPTTATVPSINGGTQPIGVVCSKTEQATTDSNGSKELAAVVTGSPRTWSYTYNEYGQVLTANGPRTDVSDVTTYTYYTATDTDLGKRGNSPVHAPMSE